MSHLRTTPPRQPRRASAAVVLLLVGAALAAPASQARRGERAIRVRLLASSEPRTVTLRAEGGRVVVRADDDQRTLAPGDEVTLRALTGLVQATSADADLDDPARRVEVEAEDGASVRLTQGRTVRTYPGTLVVTVERGGTALRLVNHVPVEPYVASVVASEYPFQEIEGAKAQAVLARTYALRPRVARDGYDVDDDQSDQVYKGLEIITPVSRRAAAQTHGEVLTYGGRLAQAQYSSSNGGQTANNEDLWEGDPLPYLRSRPDPYDRIAPDHRWTTQADVARVHAALAARFGGTVTGFDVEDRARDGRLRRVRLYGAERATITGSDFRNAINASLGWRTLKSTNLRVERAGEQYVFNGRGFGHGVGMSQYGTAQQAREGRSYRTILAFYFAGTSVEPMDRIGLEPPVLVADGGAAAPARPYQRPRVEDPDRARHLEEALRQLRESEGRDQTARTERPTSARPAEPAGGRPTASPSGWAGGNERAGSARRTAW